jgi:hypothetical protein
MTDERVNAKNGIVGHVRTLPDAASVEGEIQRILDRILELNKSGRVDQKETIREGLCSILGDSGAAVNSDMPIDDMYYLCAISLTALWAQYAAHNNLNWDQLPAEMKRKIIFTHQHIQYFAQMAQTMEQLDFLRDRGNPMPMGPNDTSLLQIVKRTQGEVLRPGLLLSPESMDVPGGEEDNQIVRLHLFIVNQIKRGGYGRRFDYVVRPHTHPRTGVRTHFYEPFMSIRDFILHCVSEDTNQEAWELFMGGGVKSGMGTPLPLSKLLDNFTMMKIPSFPDIEGDREVFSFDNGIYNTRTNQFTLYDDVPEGCVTSNYHDQHFDPRWTNCDLDEIPVPRMKRILEYQEICGEDLIWTFGMIGRLFFWTNARDRWEVMLFFMGMAGTGKSVIVKQIQLVYTTNDVSIISNEVEDFGLAKLVREGRKRWLLVAPEVNRAFRMSGMMWQSMVCGEAVSIAEKNRRDPHDIPAMDIPMVMAGNQIIFVTKSSKGSASRRLFMTNFRKVVPDNMRDSSIGHDMKQEIAAFIVMCARSYNRLLEIVGTDSVWKHAPPMFLQGRQSVLLATDPLSAFLQDKEHVTVGRGKSVSVAIFKRGFTDFCKENNMPPPAWSADLHEYPFQLTLDSETGESCPLSINHNGEGGVATIWGCVLVKYAATAHESAMKS